MQFLRIKQTYYSFMNLSHCSCISYALYITENLIDNNRTLFRHCCALHGITLGFMKQGTHLHTHACIPSPSLGPHNIYTCGQFITSVFTYVVLSLAFTQHNL